MNALLLTVALVAQCGPNGCPAPARPGLLNRIGSGLFGGADYRAYSAPMAAPMVYADAGGCYGASFAASCYSAAVSPQVIYRVTPSDQVQQTQQAMRNNRVSGRPAMARHDYPDLPAPELTTYGARREDGTMKWGVTREQAIASWRKEKPPTSRIVSPPPTRRAGTRFAANDPTPPGDPIRRVEVVSTVADGKPFDLDPVDDRGASRPPPMKGIEDTGEAAGPPPKALYCPGCGGVRAGHVDQDDTETDCIVTCLHPGCTYRFSWRNSPAQWRQVMKVCPYCRAGLEYANGCMQCTKCWFKFVIDQEQFNGGFR
jgi:hypothetical protein